MVNTYMIGYAEMCLFLFPISSIMVNIFVGLYIEQKLKKRQCGIRVLLTNQLLANCFVLLSYSLIPTSFTSLSLNTRSGLCKTFPALGFLTSTVSIMNIATLLLPGDFSHRDARKVWEWSIKAAWLAVAAIWASALLLSSPVMTAGTLVVDNCNTSDQNAVCTLVWSNDKIPSNFYANCVFVVKYATPLLLLMYSVFQQEIRRLKECRKRVMLSRITSALTVSIVLLLLYFFPLSAIDSGPFLRPNRASNSIGNYIYIFEVAVIANCAILPIILKLFVDNFLKCEKMKRLGSNYKLCDKNTKYMLTNLDTCNYETLSTFTAKKQNYTLIA